MEKIDAKTRHIFHQRIECHCQSHMQSVNWHNKAGRSNDDSALVCRNKPLFRSATLLQAAALLLPFSQLGLHPHRRFNQSFTVDLHHVG